MAVRLCRDRPPAENRVTEMVTGKLKTIAVLGAGHGGCAAAADLTARGHTGRLHAPRDAALEPLRKARGTNARGMQQGLFLIATMTTHLAAARHRPHPVIL